MRSFLLIGLVLLIAACRREPSEAPSETAVPFALQLPAGFPFPQSPTDNPITEASVAMGKALFFDARLSRDGTVSCASCHLPDRAFSDMLALSIGVDGGLGMRNAPPLGNVGYHTSYFRDGGVATLELQAIAPVHDEVEMAHNITTAAAALRYVEPYRTLSLRAYGRPMQAYDLTRALASYERTLISGWSRYDRYLQGEAAALSESELRGFQLFSSAELNCTACHGGFDLSDHAFHNVGQYMDYSDNGRRRITLQPSDEGRFKTPSLRNIALTAPYMHDGSMATLGEVIDHFASGGLPHPNRDPEMRNFDLSPEEMDDLLAFLSALTDERSIDQVP